MLKLAPPVAFNLIGAACALAAAVAGLPAASQPYAAGDAPVSVRVGYADLNLNSAAGAKAMLARIDAAARQACGTEPDIRDLQRVTVYSHCMTETTQRAVATLNAPLVTALANGSSAAQLATR